MLPQLLPMASYGECFSTAACANHGSLLENTTQAVAAPATLIRQVLEDLVHATVYARRAEATLKRQVQPSWIVPRERARVLWYRTFLTPLAALDLRGRALGLVLDVDGAAFLSDRIVRCGACTTG